nr:PREDICTED: chromodomain-helicase-DNA-binding protein 1-like isoform X4 [Lepisosteus oculatus]
MSNFLHTIKQNIPQKDPEWAVQEKDLRQWGLTGIKLRSYQLAGVGWLTQCLKNQQGCILGDEMGLGKTCQTISLLLYVSGAKKDQGPFLVLSPLSVMTNWTEELQRFAPSLSVVCYSGNKDTRAELQKDLRNKQFHVLLTTYEICLKDASFMKRWQWRVLVVDEAHRLKNQNSLLHRTLSEFSVGFRLLLTGTPIQNSLQEVYSLLSFIQPSIFPQEEGDSFINTYSPVQSQPELASELHSVLQPFLLRRVKAEVAAELPKKTEVVVYHGMSALQKKYYKAILTRDLDAFENKQGSKTRLLNILMQLRKCVNHPYLFDGVEPEPFEMGDHLIEASGKLHLLDSMLAFLHQRSHRVLLFSQMTRMLDILQDYMEYRGYSYERLDGSVRGEERNLAIKSFSHQDVFVFLLSTKAGGVGMNLTAADTVIFVDSDFNPQNDLQAAARAHRIGQTRPVKIIRLLGRDTVEEIVYRRAASKLQLTSTVIEGGQFSLLEQAEAASAGLQPECSAASQTGVACVSDLCALSSCVLRADLSPSAERDPQVWSGQAALVGGELHAGRGPGDDPGTNPAGPALCSTEISNPSKEATQHRARNRADAIRSAICGTQHRQSNKNEAHMYLYEGKDYSKDPSAEDQRSFEQLLDLQRALTEKAGTEGRALRNKSSVLLSGPLGAPLRRKRVLSEEELEQRRQRRKEAAAKRAKLREERQQQREEQQHKKKMAWWESRGYRSLCVPSEDSEEEEGGEEDNVSLASTDSEHTGLRYVLGDVTHPEAAREDAIIVHCMTMGTGAEADSSRRWRSGQMSPAGSMSWLAR